MKKNILHYKMSFLIYVYFFSGPLAGFLTHYFSIRSIIVSGVLISAVSIALCFFTPSLIYLIIFFGLFRGKIYFFCFLKDSHLTYYPQIHTCPVITQVKGLRLFKRCRTMFFFYCCFRGIF